MISCVSGRWKKNSTDRWDHMDTVLTVAMIHLPGSLAQAFSSSVILFSNPDHMERLFLYAVIFFLALRAPQAQGALTSVLESRVLCFLAAILNFFNTRAQSASARSGTEILEVWDSQILGGSDRSPEIIK